MLYIIPDKMLKVVLNTNKTGHSVLHYTWIKLVTMLYAIPDTMLKVSLNTNKTGHHVIRYAWHIVESLVKHQ
jgi:hypothetical protein